MPITTPVQINQAIFGFCATLVPGGEPVWVDHRWTPDSQIDDCFGNVANQVRTRGGSSVLGWTIWEWNGVLLEAEFHAVWRDKDGNLIDPTPKLDGERRILFLQDPDAVDEGSVVPSRYRELCDWSEVAHYIAVCRENSESLKASYEKLGGIPLDLSTECARRRKQAAEPIERRLAREALTQNMPEIRNDATLNPQHSPENVAASIEAARLLGSRGEFEAAFETLMRTAEIDQPRAGQVRETMLQLFDACADQDLVSETRRRFSQLLF